MKSFLQIFKNSSDNFSSKRIMAWIIFGLFVYATIHGVQTGSTNEFIYGGLITLLTTVVGLTSWEKIRNISESSSTTQSSLTFNPNVDVKCNNPNQCTFPNCKCCPKCGNKDCTCTS